MDIAQRRDEYRLRSLSEHEVDPDPLRQFGIWLEEALDSGLKEPAMTLATCAGDGTPSARVVLLKEFDQRGFVFYTNYRSQKGRELDANPKAALLFYWPELERQVRVTGNAARTTAEENAAYFGTRPLLSRIGAVASRQSERLPSRRELELRMAELQLKFAAGEVPCPEHWGGYRVLPERYEFWQGRHSRLHDRVVYTHARDGGWDRIRLYP